MIRQIFLRAMLVILGIAAVLGIYAVLTGSDISWRIVGSAVTLAMQFGFMLPFLPADARGRTDLLQRAVIGHLSLGGALIIATIWLHDQPSVGRTFSESMMLWIFLGNPALLVAMPALRHRRGGDRALARAEIVAIVGSAISFGTALAALLLPVGVRLDESFALGFVLLGGAALTAMCAIGIRAPSTDRFAPLPSPTLFDRSIASAGALAAAGATICGLLGVLQGILAAPIGFAPPPTPSGFWTASTVLASAAVPCGTACVLGLSRVQGASRWIGRIAILCTVCLGALIAFMAIESHRDRDPWGDVFLARLNGALAIASGAAIFASLIVMRVQRGRRFEDDPIDRISWACPRCATKSQIEPGHHTCSSCGLSVSIALRDDRCPKCGYDLHGQPLDARNCPECGRERQITSLTSA